jgi:predicted MFS family arabinose efflux permease
VLGWSLALLPPALAVYSAAQAPWQGAVTLFVVGLIYICVLSGLSTVVQLRAPEAYRGRILSFYLVALGVAYPVGSLVQGPVIERIGIGPTTAGAALLLVLIMAVTALRKPGFVRSVTGEVNRDPAAPARRARPAESGGSAACGGCDEPSARR